ncbi:MAG: hypothetical protein AAGC74_06820, partial [Verrucomicrobiota bacterium]
EFADRIRTEMRLLQERFETGEKLIELLRKSPPAGLGRDDAWGLSDHIVGGDDESLLDSPMSIPPLFGVGDYQVFHADGNTNSMMDRNLAQEVALGAQVSSEDATGLDLHQIHLANQMVALIEGPEWPDFFPELDEAKVRLGQEVFERKSYEDYRVWDWYRRELQSERVSCADCHQNPDSAEEQRYYDVGTSPLRARHYQEKEGMLETVTGRLGRIYEATKERGGYGTFEAWSWERGQTPWWRVQEGYVARALDGIWASPPYFYNASIPTLEDLFKPVGERARSFYVGNLEYDVMRVGYSTEKAEGAELFVVDEGMNTNKGHEFGAELEAEERSALIEYLKTFSRGKRGLGD